MFAAKMSAACPRRGHEVHPMVEDSARRRRRGLAIREAALLGGPHHRHEPQQRGAFGSGEQFAQGFTYAGLRASARSTVRDSDVASHISSALRVWLPIGISSGSAGHAASGSPPRRLLDDELRGFRPGALCLDRSGLIARFDRYRDCMPG